MGQKVNPHGLRVGVIEKWNSQWYAGKQEFAAYLIEDHKIREHIENKYKSSRHFQSRYRTSAGQSASVHTRTVPRQNNRAKARRYRRA